MAADGPGVRTSGQSRGRIAVRQSEAEALSEGVSADRALEVGFGGGVTLPLLLETAAFAAAWQVIVGARRAPGR